MSYVCILPNVELKNLISRTEAAPKEHHDRGMSGWEVHVEVRTQALTMFSIIFPRNTCWDWADYTGIYSYIFMYIYSLTHVNASAKLNTTCYAETCTQASTTCVCSDNSTHNLLN